MALWRVLVTAAILGVTEGSTPFAQLPCGSLFLGYATHTCLQLQLVPGSASGACADPGQSNPSGDPVLVASFNISANSPGVANVVVTDVNGTRLGIGNGQTSDGSAWSKVFDLTFECVTPGSKRVFPHAPCSCHAVLQTYYSFNCDGVCNVTGCNYNDDYGPTAECLAHAANGCVTSNNCAGRQECCQFNSSLVSLQSFWEVSCSFAVQSDPSAATFSAQQVMCGATYVEVGSTRSGLPV